MPVLPGERETGTTPGYRRAGRFLCGGSHPEGEIPEACSSSRIRLQWASAVGLALGVAGPGQRKRDPQFRQRVLSAYEYRCAVCGFDVRLGSASIGLDAAHIRWHQARGPDEEVNGLALCVLHHKTFDLGAFTVKPGGLLLVSDQVNGTAGFHEALMRHHATQIRPPQRPEWCPAPVHLDWHAREVFKGGARHHEVA